MKIDLKRILNIILLFPVYFCIWLGNIIIYLIAYIYKILFYIVSLLFIFAKSIITYCIKLFTLFKNFRFPIKKNNIKIKISNPIKTNNLFYTLKSSKIIKTFFLPFIIVFKIIKIILRLFISFLKHFQYVFLGILITSVIFVFGIFYYFIHSLPSPKLIGKINYSIPTKIYDNNQSLLYEIIGNQKRSPIQIDNLPKYIWQSHIAIEDKSFFEHNGISLSNGIIRALKEYFRSGAVQGGSTITQQLIKSSLLTSERTIDRKIREAVLAIWAEQMYSKKEILEMYLNQVAYGGVTYGIEEASQFYFGKQSNQLTLDEAALLAGLVKAPTNYSPFVHSEKATMRRNNVLKAMLIQKYITKEEYDTAIKNKITLADKPYYIKAPHFAFFVQNYLENYYGSDKIKTAGFQVTTTLDSSIQKLVEDVLIEEIEKIKHLNVNNAAALVINPKNGDILAMAGSIDYYQKPYGAFNVTTALRQPGSSIKPIMYSLALSRGFTAASILDDSPVIYDIPGSKPYAPVNYDNSYHGKVPLRYALANSYNIPAVRTLNTIGVENFIKYAQKLGITTWTDTSRYGLSLTLGGGEVRLIDLAQAFSVLANKGNLTKLDPITKIIDYNNQLIYEKNSITNTRNVISESIAFIITDILSDNNARKNAFGDRSALVVDGYKVAVKTGTSNNKRDNLTVGYTPEFLVAVWVGNNDNSPMHQSLTSGITGAAPIWNRIMNQLLEKGNIKPSNQIWYDKPASIVVKKCYAGIDEYFVQGTENVTCIIPTISPTPTP